jgi:acyl CoA:acetate/3-ketoacid CoA transferase beta subunit
MNLTHEFIAKRAAQELQDGETLNLGKGIPSLVNQFIPAGIEVMLLEEEAQWFFRPLVQ